MTIEEFLRVFPLRAANLMWFLGAGASAAAGIPTAGNLIWDFKSRLYAAAERVPTRLLDISNPTVRSRIQQYFASQSDYPPENSPEEYAVLFERAFPDDADRRRIIDQAIRQGSPSFGHHVLAALMEMDKVRAVWSTNFDRLVEDAASSAYGTTSALTTVAIDNSLTALDALNEGRWPIRPSCSRLEFAPVR
jgi:NAD-dependent SIR2 family protein deacetylase